MHGDIDRHVTCMETSTAMRHAWRHSPPCDMCGDIYHCVICVETLNTTCRKQDTVIRNLKKTRHCHTQLEENKTLSYTTVQCRLSTSQQLCDARVGKQHCLDAGYLGLYNRQQVGLHLFPYHHHHGTRAVVM